jgi:malate dehydrogenase (oxaloacetate-decarboxylating)(NADP+)
VLPDRRVFLVDTHVNLDPTAEQIAEITTMAADAVRCFGVELRSRCCRIPTSAALRRRRR